MPPRERPRFREGQQSVASLLAGLLGVEAIDRLGPSFAMLKVFLREHLAGLDLALR